MTTPEAAAAYEAAHVARTVGLGMAVWNPKKRPTTELPRIYGFNNTVQKPGAPGTLQHAALMAEDGTALGGHICSSEAYMPNDLGCLEGSRPDRHTGFQAKYPDGYVMEWVPSSQRETHAGLTAALRLNQELGEQQVRGTAGVPDMTPEELSVQVEGTR